MPNYKDGNEIKTPAVIDREKRLNYAETPEGMLSAKRDDRTTEGNYDWGKGNLEINDEGAFFTPPPGSSSVEERVTGMLGKDSPYRQAAEYQGKSGARGRGLLNSTMAETAGLDAAIRSARDIASQDAGFEQERILQQEGGEIQKGLYREQGDISSELSKQGFEQGGELSAQEAGQQRELSAQQFEQEKVIKAADLEWQGIDLKARMDVEFARMDEDTKAQLQETSNYIQDSYMTDYLEIMLNPNFETPEDRQAAVGVLNSNTKNRFEVASSIAKYELSWDIPSETGTGTTETETPAPTTPPPILPPEVPEDWIPPPWYNT